MFYTNCVSKMIKMINSKVLNNMCHIPKSLETRFHNINTSKLRENKKPWRVDRYTDSNLNSLKLESPAHKRHLLLTKGRRIILKQESLYRKEKCSKLIHARRIINYHPRFCIRISPSHIMEILSLYSYYLHPS